MPCRRGPEAQPEQATAAAGAGGVGLDVVEKVLTTQRLPGSVSVAVLRRAGGSVEKAGVVVTSLKRSAGSAERGSGVTRRGAGAGSAASLAGRRRCAQCGSRSFATPVTRTTYLLGMSPAVSARIRSCSR